MLTVGLSSSDIVGSPFNEEAMVRLAALLRAVG